MVRVRVRVIWSRVIERKALGDRDEGVRFRD